MNSQGKMSAREDSFSNAQSLPIKISGLSKHYGSVVALGGIDLHIKSGEFMTLLGPSGSGKTTLLMALAGFTRPTSGSIFFGDEEVILKPPHRREIGMMFQNYALFPHMSVFQNIAYPLKVKGVNKAGIKEAVHEVLEMVQLKDFGDRRISELSGGQKQRVGLARAVVFKPKILLMDEPLSALDKNLRESMQVELRAMHDRLGMTTVLVTHDQREALTMSDRIAVLKDGLIEQIDTAEQIYNAPNSQFVAAFMGESSFLKVAVEGQRARYNGTEIQADQCSLDQGPGLLVVRPEKLQLVSERSEGTELNYFDGKIESVLFQGESCLLSVSIQGGEILHLRQMLNRKSQSTLPEEGSSVTLALHRQDSVVVADTSVGQSNA